MRLCVIALGALFGSACTTVECGPGTHEDDGLCMPDVDTGGDADTDADSDADSDSDTDADSDADSDSDTDADSDADTDADSDADTDADTDADSDADTDADADVDTTCPPPDRWTGDVPAALYTTTPYPVTYDAGMDTLMTTTGGWGAGSFGSAYLIREGTVVATQVDARWDYMTWYYVADGTATMPMLAQELAEIGDKVTFTVGGYEGMYGTVLLKSPGAWTVDSSDNPVAVRDLGASTATYAPRRSELVHLSGTLSRVSTLNCGSGKLCFVVDHNGVYDRIRLPIPNAFGLDGDYLGTRCVEVVAPIGYFMDGNGNSADFIDVVRPEWMRVWSP